MKYSSRWLVAIIMLLGGCRAATPANTAYLQYEDKETGWSTRFPSSWEVVPEAEAAGTEGRGVKKLEATTNRKIEMTHTRLLWIRNGEKNSFTSNKMIFDFPTADGYNSNMLKIQDVLLKTYEQQGIKVDHQRSTMTIDGLEFKTFETTIHSKDGRVAGHQLYARDTLIRNWDSCLTSTTQTTRTRKY